MKKILDACCGSRMFWFDKHHPNAVYIDNREEDHVLCDGRKLEVRPDRVMDFTNMDFPDNTFSLIVFDPPHLTSLGRRSWMAKKYGKLGSDWQEVIRAGFRECWRVLKVDGTLIFKWNETDISLREVLSVITERPLFGHTSGRSSKTIWLAFMKFTNSTA